MGRENWQVLYTQMKCISKEEGKVEASWPGKEIGSPPAAGLVAP